MIRVIILSIVLFVIMIWYLLNLKEKKNYYDRYAEISRRCRRNFRTQNEVLQEIRERQNQYQQETVSSSSSSSSSRQRVDQWREERNLRPIYGPDGIRTAMRHGRPIPIYPVDVSVKDKPKEGDIKFYNGNRFMYTNGRWQFVTNEYKHPDFLSEKDMEIC